MGEFRVKFSFERAAVVLGAKKGSDLGPCVPPLRNRMLVSIHFKLLITKLTFMINNQYFITVISPPPSLHQVQLPHA